MNNGSLSILRPFEKRAEMRTVVPKRGEVMRAWRKLWNEKRHYLYSSPTKITIEIKEDGMCRICTYDEWSDE
jgi:hypothetical protein